LRFLVQHQPPNLVSEVFAEELFQGFVEGNEFWRTQMPVKLETAVDNTDLVVDSFSQLVHDFSPIRIPRNIIVVKV
jgi:hypothetical protein